MHELEALVKDLKATISSLEKELEDARAHPVIAEDTEAKHKLLLELQHERAAKEEAEKGQ